MRSRRYRALCFCLAAGAALAFSCGAADASLLKLSVGQMGRLSRTIVVGRVASSSSHWVAPAPGESGRGSIVTITRLRLIGAVKGSPGRVVTVVTPGGRVGAVRQVVDGAPVFTKGRRYVVFLDARGRVVAAREGVLDVVGGAVPALGGAPLRAAERRIARAAGVALPALTHGAVGASPAGASPGAAVGTSSGAVHGASSGRLPTVRGAPATLRTVRHPITAENAPWSAGSPLPRLGAPVNLLTDGFEGGFAWTAATFNSSGPTTTWGRSSARASAGSYSAYCVGSSVAAPASVSERHGRHLDDHGPFESDRRVRQARWSGTSTCPEQTQATSCSFYARPPRRRGYYGYGWYGRRVVASDVSTCATCRSRAAASWATYSVKRRSGSCSVSAATQVGRARALTSTTCCSPRTSGSRRSDHHLDLARLRLGRDRLER